MDRLHGLPTISITPCTLPSIELAISVFFCTSVKSMVVNCDPKSVSNIFDMS